MVGAAKPLPATMLIYLKHPLHGVKIATLEAEAIADEKNGWVRYNPKDSRELLNTLEAIVKRGRPRKEV
jgi:hypothetical protein